MTELRFMNANRRIAILIPLLVLPLLLMGYRTAAQQGKHGCTQPNASSLATAANTCGSATAPCVVDVKRTSDAASATPSIPGAKGNQIFSVQVGTTVTWQSTSKNTGFVIDFDASSPFDPPGAIIGGSDRSVSVVAKRPGCYRYSVGACVAGAIYGMCDSKNVEVIVTPAGK